MSGREAVGRSRARGAARAAGALLVVVGALALVWCALVWRWQDPVTAGYAWWQQRQLADGYRAVVSEYRPPADAPTPTRPAASLRSIAATYRRNLREGAPLGRLKVDRLGLDAVVVNGTDTASLRKGPGRDPRTYMPGQGELVYVAGHRTTFGAPFARIDALRRGDRIELDLPYGTFTYAVTGHSIVKATDLSVLRSRGRETIALQACHPRFFATERYIVWASLRRFEVAPGLRGRVRLPA